MNYLNKETTERHPHAGWNSLCDGGKVKWNKGA